MSPLYVLAGWTLMFGAGVGFTLYSIYHIVKPNEPTVFRWEAAGKSLAAMYFVGMWLKTTITGPDFLRWHLSDLGFPVAIGAIILPPICLALGWTKSNQELRDMNRYDARRYMATLTKWCVVMAVGLSCAYELFCGIIFWTHPEIAGISLIGNFDLIDVAAYLVGGFIAYFCFRKAEIIWLQEVQIEANIERERDIAAEQSRLAKQQAASCNRLATEKQRRKRK